MKLRSGGDTNSRLAPSRTRQKKAIETSKKKKKKDSSSSSGGGGGGCCPSLSLYLCPPAVRCRPLRGLGKFPAVSLLRKQELFGSSGAYYVHAQINGLVCSAVVDSGTSDMFMKKKTARRLGLLSRIVERKWIVKSSWGKRRPTYIGRVKNVSVRLVNGIELCSDVLVILVGTLKACFYIGRR